MRYFNLNYLGNESDRERALIDEGPVPKSSIMAMGEELAPKFPPKPAMRAAGRYGLRLDDYISNTLSYLIASTRMKDAIGKQSNVKVEYIPVSILNPRKSVLSSDYWIINPLGTVDCLDLANTHARGSGKISSVMGEMAAIDDYEFLEGKLKVAKPSLLRVPEWPYDLFLDEPTARALHAMKATNIRVAEVPCN